MSVRTGEPRLAAVASWAVLAASFGLSAATWIALARLSGFDGQADVFGVTVAQAWLMPVTVDGYVVVALVLWMSPVPARVATFARANTYAAALLGVTAQSAFHCLSVLAVSGVWWRGVLAAVVGAIPPGFAALAVHMRALLRRESTAPAPGAVPGTAAVPGPVPAGATPVPVPVPVPTPVPGPVAVPVPDPAGTAPVPVQVSGGDGGNGVPVDADLLARARQADVDHLAEHGRGISRDRLRATLNVKTSTASDLLRELRAGRHLRAVPPPYPPEREPVRVNGYRPGTGTDPGPGGPA